MQVLQEDEDPGEGTGGQAKKAEGGTQKKNEDKVEDEPIVMSATSFPMDMWQPEYGGWEGE